MLLLKKFPAVVLVGPDFFPALKWILRASMKACSTIDNGGGMAGVFQILGTNLSVRSLSQPEWCIGFSDFETCQSHYLHGISLFLFQSHYQNFNPTLCQPISLFLVYIYYPTITLLVYTPEKHTASLEMVANSKVKCIQGVCTSDCRHMG